MQRHVLKALGAALAVFAPLVLPSGPRGLLPVASAEECPYCHKEIEEGRGTYNCQECEKAANDIAQKAAAWTIQLKHEKPRRVTVKDDSGTPETFWWFSYTLKNTDQDAHEFSMHISAVSDKGKNLYQYEDGSVPEVVAEIRRILGMKEGETLYTQAELNTSPQGQQHQLPGKEAPPGGGSGKVALPTIKPGETFRCVAIFKKLDAEMDRLKISVHGLSNDVEVKQTDQPWDSEFGFGEKPATPNQPFRRKVKDRVLEIEYESPGDEFTTNVRPLTFVAQRWVEVERVVKTDLR